MSLRASRYDQSICVAYLNSLILFLLQGLPELAARQEQGGRDDRGDSLQDARAQGHPAFPARPAQPVPCSAHSVQLLAWAGCFFNYNET